MVHFKSHYFLPKILLIIKIITAIIATTIKTPTPIPALKIPSITEQLENENNTTKSIKIRVICFCMISKFRLKCKINQSAYLPCYTILSFYYVIWLGLIFSIIFSKCNAIEIEKYCKVICFIF